MKTAVIISVSLIIGIFIGIFISNYKVVLKSESIVKQESKPLSANASHPKDKESKSVDNKPKFRKESIPCVCGAKQYSYTSSRLLKLKELEGLTKSALRIMRNEIFACHGFEFKSSDLVQYFNNRNGDCNIKRSNVDEYLSEIEIKNISTISIAEKNAQGEGTIYFGR
jgi:hypothetical protein